jgi:hypothetical protein
MRSVPVVLAALCLLALVATLCGCGSSGADVAPKGGKGQTGWRTQLSERPGREGMSSLKSLAWIKLCLTVQRPAGKDTKGCFGNPERPWRREDPRGPKLMGVRAGPSDVTVAGTRRLACGMNPSKPTETNTSTVRFRKGHGRRESPKGGSIDGQVRSFEEPRPRTLEAENAS